jgi:hypothetical protein
MLRKKIYQWHRTTSLIIAIPVILWAASGFMHPIMTTIRPKVATQWLMPSKIDSSKIKISLQTALANNHVDSFTNFRLVHIDTNWFYQVHQGVTKEPIYISTNNGKLLPQGEWLYAQYLAKQFLEGKFEVNKSQNNTSSNGDDCCSAASNCVLNNSKGSKVTNVSTITQFTDEYKSVNKLLPVQCVSFNREDGIRVYVETSQDRFAFAMDNKRAVFDKIFQVLHTWSWLNFLGKGKLLLEGLLSLLAFITSMMGLYIFFISKKKKVKGNELVKARNNHRFVSVSIALFTLMFSLSGCYHAFSKLKEDNRLNYYDEHRFAANQVDFDLNKIQLAVHKPITNISLVHMNGKHYWQVNTAKQLKENSAKKADSKDLMKTKQVSAPSAIYLSLADYTQLSNGEQVYAQYLANKFSKHEANEIKSITTITKFEGEYGFVNKRLPVFKVSYSTNNNDRYYVETASGKLALQTNDKDAIEGYSFAFLHKHEFLAWAGKPVKDFSTMFWAFAQIVMVGFGLTLWLKSKRVKPQQL